MHCPNYPNCRLIQIEGLINQSLKARYSDAFCLNVDENWQNCKRFQTNMILHFCPDFVMPDSGLTLDEIIDRFDLENNSPTKN